MPRGRKTKSQESGSEPKPEAKPLRRQLGESLGEIQDKIIEPLQGYVNAIDDQMSKLLEGYSGSVMKFYETPTPLFGDLNIRVTRPLNPIITALEARRDIQKFILSLKNRGQLRLNLTCQDGHTILVAQPHEEGPPLARKWKISDADLEQLLHGVVKSIPCPVCGKPATLSLNWGNPYFAGLYEGIKYTIKFLDNTLETKVREHPLWPWLGSINGIGELKAARIIAQLEYSEARHGLPLSAHSLMHMAGLNTIFVCYNCGLISIAPALKKGTALCPKCSKAMTGYAPTKINLEVIKQKLGGLKKKVLFHSRKTGIVELTVGDALRKAGGRPEFNADWWFATQSFLPTARTRSVYTAIALKAMFDLFEDDKKRAKTVEALKRSKRRSRGQAWSGVGTLLGLAWRPVARVLLVHSVLMYNYVKSKKVVDPAPSLTKYLKEENKMDKLIPPLTDANLGNLPPLLESFARDYGKVFGIDAYKAWEYWQDKRNHIDEELVRLKEYIDNALRG